MRPAFQVLCLALCAGLGGGAPVTISNVLPRRDAAGALMDLHDGTILLINSTYFYWGMSYGLCNITKSGCDGLWYPPHCGYRTNHNLSLYTSPDLVHWTFALDALPMAARPPAVYYRPQVVHNAATGQYVLWINSVPFWPGNGSSQDPNYFGASYLVATSPSPLAPFAVLGRAATSRGALGVGDLSLFVDQDGAGYAAYAAWAAGVHAVTVERLTADYTNSSLAASGLVTPPFYEAPLLFARGGAYFLLSGPTCCFCAEGAASRLYTAAHPLGPWADTGAFVDPPGAANASLLGAQNSMLVQVPLAGGERGLVWAGDRWGSADDGLFGHNKQFWGLLQWDDAAAPPRVAALQWQDTLSLDLAA